MKTYSIPATPSRTRFSAVIVPVLSKQQTSTRPANGILNGSVQKIATQNYQNPSLLVANKSQNIPNFDNATKLALTAKLNSIGNSGGTTLVMINTQSSNNFDFFKFLSIPFVHTYQLAAIAKIKRNPMKRKLSKLFAETLSLLKIMVLTS